MNKITVLGGYRPLGNDKNDAKNRFREEIKEIIIEQKNKLYSVKKRSDYIL